MVLLGTILLWMLAAFGGLSLAYIMRMLVENRQELKAKSNAHEPYIIPRKEKNIIFDWEADWDRQWLELHGIAHKTHTKVVKPRPRYSVYSPTDEWECTCGETGYYVGHRNWMTDEEYKQSLKTSFRYHETIAHERVDAVLNFKPVESNMLMMKEATWEDDDA